VNAWSDFLTKDLSGEIRKLADEQMQMFYGGWPATRRKLPDYPRTRMNLCYHEAGHAVMARIVKFNARSATVEVFFDNGATGGNVCLPKGSDSREPAPDMPPFLMRLASIQLAAIYLAGFESEQIYHGIELPGCLLIDAPDIRNASQFLCATYGTAQGLYYVQRLARVILRTTWDFVQAVAYELDAKGTLTEVDLEELLGDLEPLPEEVFYVPLHDDLGHNWQPRALHSAHTEGS
jgi:hypothetical protein